MFQALAAIGSIGLAAAFTNVFFIPVILVCAIALFWFGLRDVGWGVAAAFAVTATVGLVGYLLAGRSRAAAGIAVCVVGTGWALGAPLLLPPDWEAAPRVLVALTLALMTIGIGLYMVGARRLPDPSGREDTTLKRHATIALIQLNWLVPVTLTAIGWPELGLPGAILVILGILGTVFAMEDA